MRKILLLFLMLITSLFLGLSLIDKKAQAGFFDFFYKNRQELVVLDNQILLDNEPIILRGVAVGSPYFRLTKDGRTSQDYEIIKKTWKANIVRLSVHPGVYKKDEKETKQLLEKEIKVARKQGLFVIVDWHAIGFPDGWHKPWDRNEYGNNYYSSNFKKTENFWKYMALKYRSDRGVFFELWNEPADERNIAWQDIKPYIERLYGIIRSQGADNIIIAPGVHWTYDLRGIKNDPMKGKNISYAWHNYPFCSKYLTWDDALDNLNKYYPIFITEWGFSTDPDSRHYALLDDFAVRFKKYILDRNLNFTAWCWHGAWLPNMFERNWHDLTDFGRFTKDFLAEMEILDKVNDFIKFGVDYNSRKLGEGERRAAVYSYQVAFGQIPKNNSEWQDLIKISNGRWPSKRSELAEEKAKKQFKKIYQREANINNEHDNAAIMIMAYGLRQRAERRNLNSERQGISIFKNIYGKYPATTEEWNIMQAITYSGAVR